MTPQRRPRRRANRRMAWGIEPRYTAWPSGSLMGVGWFGWPKDSHMAATRIAGWETRREAKLALPSVKRYHPRARVVRIETVVRMVSRR